MLPRKNRISRTEFPSFKENKKIWKGTVLQITVYKGTASQNRNKAAVVVGKRFGVAVKRNNFKRAVYEAMSKHITTKTSEKPEKFIITVQSGIKDISKTDIQNDAEKYFRERNES